MPEPTTVVAGRPIPILITGHHALLADTLATTLETRTDLDVAVCALDTLREAVERHAPRLVIFDHRHRASAATTRLGVLRNDYPTLRTLFVGLDIARDADVLTHASAIGWVSSRSSLREFLHVMHHALTHSRSEGLLCCGHAGRELVEQIQRRAARQRQEERSTTLTSRERQILALIGAARSNRDIARRLNLSEHTVKNHMSRILRKLEVKDRHTAMTVARRRGWLEEAVPRPVDS
ncbi:MAG: response regulator transcription factor [Acidobacteriota bacterium]